MKIKFTDNSTERVQSLGFYHKNISGNIKRGNSQDYPIEGEWEGIIRLTLESNLDSSLSPAEAQLFLIEKIKKDLEEIAKNLELEIEDTNGKSKDTAAS